MFSHHHHCAGYFTKRCIWRFLSHQILCCALAITLFRYSPWYQDPISWHEHDSPWSKLSMGSNRQYGWFISWVGVGRFFIGISWKMRWLPFFQDTQYIPRFSTDVIGWFDVSWMIQWWTATNHPANRVAPINAGGWFCFPADWWFAQLGKWLP